MNDPKEFSERKYDMEIQDHWGMGLFFMNTGATRLNSALSLLTGQSSHWRDIGGRLKVQVPLPVWGRAVSL